MNLWRKSKSYVFVTGSKLFCRNWRRTSWWARLDRFCFDRYPGQISWVLQNRYAQERVKIWRCERFWKRCWFACRSRARWFEGRICVWRSSFATGLREVILILISLSFESETNKLMPLSLRQYSKDWSSTFVHWTLICCRVSLSWGVYDVVTSFENIAGRSCLTNSDLNQYQITDSRFQHNSQQGLKVFYRAVVIIQNSIILRWGIFFKNFSKANRTCASWWLVWMLRERRQFCTNSSSERSLRPFPPSVSTWKRSSIKIFRLQFGTLEDRIRSDRSGDIIIKTRKGWFLLYAVTFENSNWSKKRFKTHLNPFFNQFLVFFV